MWLKLKICLSYSWSWCCYCWELQSSLILMVTWQQLGLVIGGTLKIFCKQSDHNLIQICQQFQCHLQSVLQLYKSWKKEWPQLYGRPMAARYWWIKNNYLFSFKQFTTEYITFRFLHPSHSQCIAKWYQHDQRYKIEVTSFVQINLIFISVLKSDFIYVRFTPHMNK